MNKAEDQDEEGNGSKLTCNGFEFYLPIESCMGSEEAVFHTYVEEVIELGALPGDSGHEMPTEVDKEEIATEIDKSFQIFDPIQWFKWRFPRFIFTALMLLESYDVVSDIGQLRQVLQKFGKYNAPPFAGGGSGTGAFSKKQYSVMWEKVQKIDEVTGDNVGDPMLGFELEWKGNPSGVWNVRKDITHFFEFDCLVNGEDDHEYFSNKVKDRGSNYLSEPICVPLSDVFSFGFPKPFPRDLTAADAEAICPNNVTAIFDENSFRVTSQQLSDPTIDNEGCESYGCGQVLTVDAETKEPLNMTNYYKPGWTSGVLKYHECNTLYIIFICTVVLFSIEAAFIFLQLLQFTLRLRQTPPDTVDKKELREYHRYRIRALVEYPLLGFILALCILTKEEWDVYADMDYDFRQPHPEYLLVSRICGLHERKNFLYNPVWSKTANYYYYYYKNDCNDSPPEHVTLGQKSFHSFLYPVSTSFKEVMLGDGFISYWFFGLIYYCTLPFLCVWSFVNFCTMHIAPFLLLALAYGDKLMLSRILFDLPNFCLALTYMILIEFNAASLQSTLISGFFILYHVSDIAYNLYKDCVRPSPPQLFPIDNLYGKVSGRWEGLYQAFLMPIFMTMWWWIILPIAFFRNSWVYASNEKFDLRAFGHLFLILLFTGFCVMVVVLVPMIIEDVTNNPENYE